MDVVALNKYISTLDIKFWC